jgi:hypothetical protein
MGQVPSTIAILAFADLGGCRIERIFLKDEVEEAVRFRDCRPGRFNPRMLCLSEDELLILLGDAIAASVFSRGFLAELRAILDARELAQYA